MSANNGDGMKRTIGVLGWLLGAIALVASTQIAASAWKGVRTHKERSISVTGSAKRRIVSDLIGWDASIETRGADRVAAYKDLRKHTEAVLAYLKKQGVADAEIRVSSVTTRALFETEYLGAGDNRVERSVPKGFETKQVITVHSTEVDKIERISREVTQLIETGVPVTSSPPSYYYTKLGELKIEMLAEAAKDARQRGGQILKSAGNSDLGKLVRADMGVININEPNSTATSWEGNNDTTSLDKDIITIVHCTFDID